LNTNYKRWDWKKNGEKCRTCVGYDSFLSQAPNPSILETFLGNIPIVFNVVILLPHGYFGKEIILGLPDTGGQFIYILDQVRALENEMLLRTF
jgi:sucrose synthase